MITIYNWKNFIDDEYYSYKQNCSYPPTCGCISTFELFTLFIIRALITPLTFIIDIVLIPIYILYFIFEFIVRR